MHINDVTLIENTSQMEIYADDRNIFSRGSKLSLDTQTNDYPGRLSKYLNKIQLNAEKTK